MLHIILILIPSSLIFCSLLFIISSSCSHYFLLIHFSLFLTLLLSFSNIFHHFLFSYLFTSYLLLLLLILIILLSSLSSTHNLLATHAIRCLYERWSKGSWTWRTTSRIILQSKRNPWGRKVNPYIKPIWNLFYGWLNAVYYLFFYLCNLVLTVEVTFLVR